MQRMRNVLLLDIEKEQYNNVFIYTFPYQGCIIFKLRRSLSLKYKGTKLYFNRYISINRNNIFFWEEKVFYP